MSSQETPIVAFIPPSSPRMLSLFWKVLVLVLLTAVIATISIGLYFRYTFRDSYTEFLGEQTESYLRLITEQVGAPPNIQNAQRIAAQYPVDIRVEGNGTAQATDTTIASSNIIAQESAPIFFRGRDESAIKFREYNNRFYGIQELDGWTYIVRLRSPTDEESLLPVATIILVVILILLCIAAYASVKHFLRPVNELMEGVTAMGSGDFDYQVPLRSNDELGDLTLAFNAMSQRVADIIASKRRLLFDVSHELRSPLARMRIALAMLPEGKARNTIERNALELNTMITELLENERLAVLGGSLVVEDVDIVQLAAHVVESFGDDMDRIEFDSLTGSLEVRADSQRLTVALRNVISNALKYSSESDKAVKVTVFPDDDGVRIIVKDYGIGISEEAVEKVFEPFYRTDDSRSRATGGYGLGLSLTKSIVEAHGGTIQLQSALGLGTVITMWFPYEPTPGNVAPMRQVQQAAAQA